MNNKHYTLHSKTANIDSKHQTYTANINSKHKTYTANSKHIQQTLTVNRKHITVNSKHITVKSKVWNVWHGTKHWRLAFNPTNLFIALKVLCA